MEKWHGARGELEKEGYVPLTATPRISAAVLHKTVKSDQHQRAGRVSSVRPDSPQRQPGIPPDITPGEKDSTAAVRPRILLIQLFNVKFRS